ncbi:hypothetical protein VTN02DRAFT_3595 [Thermoascus thermophilus]
MLKIESGPPKRGFTAKSALLRSGGITRHRAEALSPINAAGKPFFWPSAVTPPEHLQEDERQKWPTVAAALLVAHRCMFR